MARYWLFKSEPDTYSWDDLVAEGRTHWDGVRNYEARNLLRDTVSVGDGVLFYHSNAKPLCVMGTAKVVKAGYPDHTAWDPDDDHYDPKSDPSDPTWYMVDIKPKRAFKTPVTRERLKESVALSEMMLLRRGARLSVQPVSKKEWDAIVRMGTK